MRESTAAALLALVLYAPVSLATVLIIMSPILSSDRAGWIYCNLYLLAHLFWVLWLRNTVNRQSKGDKGFKCSCCMRLCKVFGKLIRCKCCRRKGNNDGPEEVSEEEDNEILGEMFDIQE